jgi:hypothetical protein
MLPVFLVHEFSEFEADTPRAHVCVFYLQAILAQRRLLA